MWFVYSSVRNVMRRLNFRNRSYAVKVKLQFYAVAQRSNIFWSLRFLHFLRFFEVEIHQKRFIIFLLQRATRVRMDWIHREVNFRKLSSKFVKNSKLSTPCNFKGSDCTSMFNFNISVINKSIKIEMFRAELLC